MNYVFFPQQENNVMVNPLQASIFVSTGNDGEFNFLMHECMWLEILVVSILLQVCVINFLHAHMLWLWRKVSFSGTLLI